MSDEQETFQVKPDTDLTMEKFKKEANEYLAKLEEYKLLDKTMKQYEANIKAFMVDNDLDIYSNEIGRITIDYSKVNRFDRSLIEDIHQYYRETDVIIMRKTLKSVKPVKKEKS